MICTIPGRDSQHQTPTEKMSDNISRRGATKNETWVFRYRGVPSMPPGAGASHQECLRVGGRGVPDARFGEGLVQRDHGVGGADAGKVRARCYVLYCGKDQTLKTINQIYQTIKTINHTIKTIEQSNYQTIQAIK